MNQNRGDDNTMIPRARLKRNRNAHVSFSHDALAKRSILFCLLNQFAVIKRTGNQ
jgi:hypothetical protein